MSQYLLRTQFAIEECEQHLNKYSVAGTSIEAYLTQHILVLLCAEIQQCIYNIVSQRVSGFNVASFDTYVSNSQSKLLRGVKVDAISGFLAIFSSKAKSVFNNSLNDEEITIYNNAVKDRHDVAHKHGATISFDELKKANVLAEKVLSAINTALQDI